MSTNALGRTALGSLTAVAVVLCAGAYITPARAETQVNVGVIPAVALSPERGLAFDGAIVADVIFGRTNHREVGFGPRFEVGTYAFDDLRVALGPTLQVGSDPIDLVPGVHGLMHVNDGQASAGIGARLFIGLRPYNYYYAYGAAVGLSMGVDHVFRGAGEQMIYLGAHLDAMWLSLPVLILLQAL